MKAIVYNKYGSPDVLELKEVEKPIHEDNQVLVKVHAASVNYGNLVLLRGKPFLARFAFGLLKPKYSIPGGDIEDGLKMLAKTSSSSNQAMRCSETYPVVVGVVLPNT